MRKIAPATLCPKVAGRLNCLTEGVFGQQIFFAFAKVRKDASISFSAQTMMDDLEPFSRLANLAGGDDADRVWADVGRTKMIEIALRELPQQTADILLLVLLDHVKQSDIARLYRVSLNAVESQLLKALAHIARKQAASNPG